MVSIKQRGNFKKTQSFLKSAKKSKPNVKKYGELGVKLLSEGTPVDTGKTASSWEYSVENKGNSVVLSFYNTNVENGVCIALILDTGWATKNGYWIEGRHYIEPSIQPLFDRLALDAWKEVNNV